MVKRSATYWEPARCWRQCGARETQGMIHCGSRLKLQQVGFFQQWQVGNGNLTITGWWSGTCFIIFHIYIYIWYGNNHPNWRTQVFQRGRSTTSGGWQQLIAHGSNHGTERRHQHFGASLPLSYLSSTMARWEVPERNSTWGHRIICRCRKCVIFHWQVWLLEGTVANLMVHPSLVWRSAFPCFSLQKKCRTEAGNRVPYRILLAQLG